ncbi:ABC transporter substrate-binding protein [Falsirhodobacter sp. 1013]|uniref:ABC transporter substrate-binding protein n=1 Tax=Falsirhodobacter sp. 1013 TaxID=3417566 RepID=UPI003EBFEB5E
MHDLSRRSLLQLLAIGTVASQIPGFAWAQDGDGATVAWPSDVPSWDPNQRLAPDAQSIFKLVYDQPLMQDTDLSLIPSVVTKWDLAPDGLSLAIEIRDDVLFHDGTKLTMEDVRYTFFERVQEKQPLDIANVWGKITDIEVASPTTGTIRLSAPMPTAPQWLAFMGSYIVPKAYITKVGLDGFRERPIGSGPYKLAGYQMNSRIVLERFDGYWGAPPALKTITVNIIKDAAARVAAVQSGQADLTINVPVREVDRLSKAGFAGEINPITRVILLQIRNDLGFADENVRLAAHHAIDKKALSRAFYAGAAVPLSVPATPGTPGYVEDYEFAFDPAKAKELLATSGFGPDNPARIRFAATNGHFPSDHDIARALVQMWQKVGIVAELEIIEYAKYFELNRGQQLPEATLYTFDNATGDPEIFSGYLLNPKMPFSPWKGEQPGDRLPALFAEPDYEKRIAGYKQLSRDAVEMGACIPILQSVQTLVRRENLTYRKYANGWVLGGTMALS